MQGEQADRSLRTVVLGAGSLGRAFLRRLRDDGGPVRLVGLVTAHHGAHLSPTGIDAGEALSMAEAGELGETVSDVPALFQRLEADLLVECIPQNIRTGEPALGYMRAALERGLHVVTANKAPVVLGYRELQAKAQQGGREFRFGAAVLDGLPIFDFVKQLRGQRVVKARGVLNATSSVVLETVGDGGSRARGLARAQARGIAEADPVLDLDGWDAAAKAALLANVWMEANFRVVDVHRSGLENLKDSAVVRAAAEGRRYRLVAEVLTDGTHVGASVAPVALEADDPLYGLTGACGGLEITTDQGSSMCLLQRSAGLMDAAGGLLADCRAIASEPS